MFWYPRINHAQGEDALVQDRHDENTAQLGVDVGVIVGVDDCVCVEDEVPVDVAVIEDVAVTAGVDVGVLQEATSQSTVILELLGIRPQTPPPFVYSTGVWQDVTSYPLVLFVTHPHDGPAQLEQDVCN